MTAKERIEAAIAARDKATPGPLKVVFKGAIDKYTVEKQEGGVHKQLAYCGHADALLFTAAPDLVDEVIRLRKLLSGAVEMLDHQNMYFFSTGFDEEEYQINLEKIRRLIAEAQED